MSLPALVRTNRVVRSAAFAYCVLPIGLYLWERDAGTAAWALLALQFFLYPQLVYWRAARSPHPTRTELDNLFLDSALLAASAADLCFPILITFSLLPAPIPNASLDT